MFWKTVDIGTGKITDIALVIDNHQVHHHAPKFNGQTTKSYIDQVAD